jgi:hypothetical protein
MTCRHVPEDKKRPLRLLFTTSQGFRNRALHLRRSPGGRLLSKRSMMTNEKDAAATSEQVVHIAVGAEAVTERSNDEVAARLKSFDLRRHRTRADQARWPVAVCLTVLLLLTALWSSNRHSAPAVADAFVTEESEN